MTTRKFRTIELVYMAAFVALIAVCAWISIPSAVPFTMQTFAICLTLLLLGGKRGSMTILVYLLLGAVGAPIFSNFSGGLGALFGTTGGYLLGFLGTALLYWAMVKDSRNLLLQVVALVLGLLVCYALGTAWFVTVYTQNTGEVGVFTALSWCVIPYLIPDALKLALAVLLGGQLRRHIKLS